MKLTLRDQVFENWSIYKTEFSPDGSLRDICVFGTDINDWAKAAGIIASQRYGLEFRQKFTGRHFPEDLQGLFPSSANEEFTLLSVDISGVLLNCHFFTQEQIEFDLDPAEVKSAEQLAKLFEFMYAVAGAVGKDVLMTPENEEQHPIFRCRPSSVQIEYQAFFNGATSFTVFDSK